MNRLFKYKRGFTLTEVIITMALFGMISLIVVTLLNTVLSSSTESQQKIEVSANASTTKEVLIRTLEPSTEVEILRKVESNDLTSYITDPASDYEYSYLYTINGDVYYRSPYDKDKNPTGVVVGEKIPMLSSTDVELTFKANTINPKTLEVGMTFTSKGNDPYELDTGDAPLLITPLNLPDADLIKDNRTEAEKNDGSNIIRFKSSEVILTNTPQPSDGLQIVSIVVEKANSDINEDVAFTVSQEPREVTLVSDSAYVNLSTNAVSDELDDNENPKDPVNYYKNTVIRQTKYLSKLNQPKILKITYKGQYFIDANGIIKAGELNSDGTKTLEYALPLDQYNTTGKDLHFAVTSKDGEYLEYDWNVITSVPEPEIVRFEFLKEDNYNLQNNKRNIAHDIKTYINQNDVYFANNSLNGSSTVIAGTAANTDAPNKFPSLTNPGTLETGGKSFYSTIVLPLNQKHDKFIDDYPSINDSVGHNGTNYLTTRVATVTFKGTSLYDPTGKEVTISPAEKSKLNGISEVSVKISVDTDDLGNVYYLNGEQLEKLEGVTDEKILSQYYAYTNGKNQTWFDPNTQPIFTVSTLTKANAKRYVYQKEHGTTTPDYHEGTNVDAGLTKIWVDGYLDGAWVGGSMRGRVADTIEISYPYDQISSLGNDLKIDASAYGEYLAYLPAYINGTFDSANRNNGNGSGSGSGDNIGYYELDPTENTTVTLLNSKTITVDNKNELDIAYPTLNNSADSLKHLLVLQSLDVNNAVTPYTVKVVPDYPINVMKPQIVNIRVNETIGSDGTWNLGNSQPASIQRNYVKGENTFLTNTSLDSSYTGRYTNLDISFAGSKIEISESMNPTDRAVLSVKNPLESKEFAYLATLNIPYSNEYYIHLYDYSGKVSNTYRIMQNSKSSSGQGTRMRSTAIYKIASEISKDSGATGLNNKSNIYKRPFLPIKTSLVGASYGNDMDLMFTDKILSGDFSAVGTFVLKKFPFVFPNDTYFAGSSHYNYFMAHAGGEDSSTYKYTYGDIQRDVYTSENFRTYSDYNGLGSFATKYKMYIKTTVSRYFNSYTLGGNNLSTMPVYNVSTMMTPIKHDTTLTSTGTYNTDRFMGDTDQSGERANMKPSNVKFDTTGFMMHIQTDRPIDELNMKNPVSRTTPLQGFGRPGATTMTTFDVALVDKPEFYTDYGMATVVYSPFTKNSYIDKINFNNKPVYDEVSEINNNDVIGFGFALVENNVDRDFTQNYLGTDSMVNDLLSTTRKSETERQVSLMFYTRQFLFENGDSKLPKSPASFVKICDIDAFKSSVYTTGGLFGMNTQGVNFNVDVKTTFNGNTVITKDNYDSIMKNNYIDFTVIEMDYAGNPNGNISYQRLSFADVFGGVRVDDEYRELNLLLNQIPRVAGEKVYLSTGYNTNYGTVGITDFSILK